MTCFHTIHSSRPHKNDLTIWRHQYTWLYASRTLSNTSSGLLKIHVTVWTMPRQITARSHIGLLYVSDIPSISSRPNDIWTRLTPIKTGHPTPLHTGPQHDTPVTSVYSLAFTYTRRYRNIIRHICTAPWNIITLSVTQLSSSLPYTIYYTCTWWRLYDQISRTRYTWLFRL